MDTIAVISDVHGNLEALKAVLADIHLQEISEIFCLGDTVAKGTHQQECSDLIRKHCSVILQGNCEYYFTHDRDSISKSELEESRYQWNKSMVTEETRAFLRELPYCHEMKLSGRLVRFLHATPGVINGFVGNIDTIDRAYSLFLPGEYTLSQEKADVLVYGHIHTPYAQKLYNRILLNTGSVGNAIDIIRDDERDGDEMTTTTASYLILRGVRDSEDRHDRFSYELVSVPYDIDKELENEDRNLEPESYREELLHGRYRDMAKIRKLYESIAKHGT